MQNVAASEAIMFDSAVFEPAAFEPAVFEPVVFQSDVLQPDTAPDVQAVKTRTAAPTKTLLRTLLLKWDMIAIVAFMLATAVYGVYAVCFLS